jgi:hypothetical protein
MKNKTDWTIWMPAIIFGGIAGALTNYNIIYTIFFGVLGSILG